MMRIVLTGFMGAGKTTVGLLLAERLGWLFADVDQELARAEGASVAEIFEQRGEPRFRVLEEQTIARLLQDEQLVIALGGGALESGATRSRLASTPGTQIVFLETPFAVALARCRAQGDGAIRPVLRDEALLAGRFERRLEHYGQAHHTLSTADRSPDELAAMLLATLQPMLRA